MTAIKDKTPAESALYAISRKCFGGKNYNNEFWYDANILDGGHSGIRGAVHKIIEKGKSREIGPFYIEPNGYICAFPFVPDKTIAELNQGKDAPVFEKPLVELNEKPKKRRGRPKKTTIKDV